MPEVGITLLPDDKGVESLARQIRMTGRAYPLFEIAQMILQRPDRLSVIFNVKKNAEGKPIQPLFVAPVLRQRGAQLYSKITANPHSFTVLHFVDGG